MVRNLLGRPEITPATPLAPWLRLGWVTPSKLRTTLKYTRFSLSSPDRSYGSVVVAEFLDLLSTVIDWVSLIEALAIVGYTIPGNCLIYLAPDVLGRWPGVRPIVTGGKFATSRVSPFLIHSNV